VLTAAMLDPILRHSIIVSICGNSYRLKDKRKRECFHPPDPPPGVNPRRFR
jgi:hypothetical protein